MLTHLDPSYSNEFIQRSLSLLLQIVKNEENVERFKCFKKDLFLNIFSCFPISFDHFAVIATVLEIQFCLGEKKNESLLNYFSFEQSEFLICLLEKTSEDDSQVKNLILKFIYRLFLENGEKSYIHFINCFDCDFLERILLSQSMEENDEGLITTIELITEILDLESEVDCEHRKEKLLTDLFLKNFQLRNILNSFKQMENQEISFRAKMLCKKIKTNYFRV